MTIATPTLAQLAVREEDWDWADSLFEASDLFETCGADVEETEYFTDTGNHVYQLDSGDVIVVTPTGDVLIDDWDDLDVSQ